MANARVELALRYAYHHSSVGLRIACDAPFAVRVAGAREGHPVQLGSLGAGRVRDRLPLELEAVAGDGGYVVDALLRGVLLERPIAPLGATENPASPGEPEWRQSTLGARFYPFVSSTVQVELALDGAEIELVEIEVGEPLRVRPESFAAVTAGGARPDQVLTRYDGDEWHFTLSWAAPQTALRLDGLHVQTRASLIAPLVNGLALAFAATLAAVAFLRVLGAPDYALAAPLVAFWLALVQTWRASPRAHHLTVVTLVSIAMAIVAFDWTATWQAEVSRWWTLVPGALAAALLAWVLPTVPYFEATGQLQPRFVEPIRAVNTLFERSRDWQRDRVRGRVLRRLLPDARATEVGPDRLVVASAGATATIARAPTRDPRWDVHVVGDDRARTAISLRYADARRLIADLVAVGLPPQAAGAVRELRAPEAPIGGEPG